MSKTSNKSGYQQKLADVKAMEEMLRMQQGLPHLFGFKHYDWSRKIFESTNPEIYCTAANQLGKSLSAIRKNIALATDPSLWKKFWPGLEGNRYPSLFWYFLPTLANATTEVETKWIPFYLPQNEYKDDKQFGWKAEFFKGEIHAINFNSGVQIQFKSYTQKLTDLQSATVYHITCDEEPPVDYLPELRARLNATDGKMLSVFTATRGQDYFRRIMEPLDSTDELQKDALKIQISLYDSQYYEDGTPSPWTDAKIKRAIANCPTPIEVQRRIYGKFVKTEGLKYESFDMERNTITSFPLEKDCLFYSGVDIGSGGKSGHPSAIIFLAVKPDYKGAYVFRGWRGDGIITASNDVVAKYVELRDDLTLAGQVYDYSARDFFTYASRIGLAFRPADKSRDSGASLLNTLFKTGMLKIFRDDPELVKLIQELQSLGSTVNKSVAVDDMIDALRYCAQQIPWDFSDIPIESLGDKKTVKVIREKTDPEKRRDWFFNKGEKTEPTIEDELDDWNELY